MHGLRDWIAVVAAFFRGVVLTVPVYVFHFITASITVILQSISLSGYSFSWLSRFQLHSRRHLLSDNCRRLAGLGAFWQLQRDAIPSCEGESLGFGNPCFIR